MIHIPITDFYGKSVAHCNNELILRLDLARRFHGKNFFITSALRGDGEHALGLAVDIRVRGSAERGSVVRALCRAGFLRIGVYDRHVHAGLDPSRPQGMWAGVSK